MTSSREKILGNIKKNQPAFPQMAEPSIKAITFQDPYLQFFAVLTTIGGVAIEIGSPDEISEHLAAKFPSFKRIVNRVGGLSIPKDESLASDPHLLENVDFAILPGTIAVAENGAVWVEDKDMGDRALPFITQHLGIVIERNAIVNNMQEAYTKLGAAAYAFGTFIAGPSKTADIEQSLVLGAHGAKSLTVFVLE
jgi:L-lactate dehydrogenase complex protein LldG